MLNIKAQDNNTAVAIWLSLNIQIIKAGCQEMIAIPLLSFAGLMMLAWSLQVKVVKAINFSNQIIAKMIIIWIVVVIGYRAVTWGIA